MHFDVYPCTSNIIIPYSFGFFYCPPNILHSAFSWVLKYPLYSWILRGIVFHVMDIPLFDYFLMAGHLDFAQLFTV